MEIQGKWEACKETVITRFLLPLSRRGNRRSRLEIFSHCRSRPARSVVTEIRIRAAALVTAANLNVSRDRARVSRGKPEKRAPFRNPLPPHSSAINCYCAAACPSFLSRATHSRSPYVFANGSDCKLSE